MRQVWYKAADIIMPVRQVLSEASDITVAVRQVCEAGVVGVRLLI